MQALKQSTQIKVRIGPFMDATDAVTPETGVTLGVADQAELLKNNGAATVDISGATWAAVTGCDGWYDLTLTTSHTDTVGLLEVVVQDTSLCLPVFARFMVVEETVFDTFYASGADLNASVISDLDSQVLLNASMISDIDSQLLVTHSLVSDVYSLVSDVDSQVLATASLVSDIDSMITEAYGGLIAETHDSDVLAQFQKLTAVVEHQRGGHTHQPIGKLFFVDPTNGDTHANGNRGGISDPYAGVQDCHDNAVTDSNHDMIILLSGASGGSTTLTEDVTISKRYLSIRGPGRDFTWTRSGAGDTIAVTADGVELFGFQVGTAATGSGNGITVTSADFFRASRLWVNDTQGHGIQLTDSDNAQIIGNSFQNTGAGGAGHGLVLDAGNGQSGDSIIVKDNHFHGVTGDCVRLNPSGSGTVNDAVVSGNHFSNATGDGVDITGSGANRAAIHGNVFGNISGSNINDSGTNTRRLNNEQWATGYTGNAVHLNTNASNTSTQDFEDGTESKPVSTIGAAKTIADSVGLQKIQVASGSSFTLAASMDDFTIEGEQYDLGLGSQSISNCSIMGATITGGTSTAANAPIFERCIFDTNLTLPACIIRDSFFGDITFTLGTGNYFFNGCTDRATDTAAPDFDFGAAVGNTSLNFHDYSGAAELENMGDSGTDTAIFSGRCRVIGNANCSGGTVTTVGSIPVNDASGNITVTHQTMTQTWYRQFMDDGTTAFDRSTDSLQEIRDHQTQLASDISDIDSQLTVTHSLVSDVYSLVSDVDSQALLTASMISDIDSQLTVSHSMLSDVYSLVSDVDSQLAVTHSLLSDVESALDAHTTNWDDDTEAISDFKASIKTVVRGAAEAGTLSDTQMTTDLTEATDDHFNGRTLIWTSGVLKDQATDITDYQGSDGMLTYTGVTESPSASDSFVIV